MENKQSICFVATVDFAVNAFLLNHLRELSNHYNLTLVTNLQNPNFLNKNNLNIKLININFSRNINIFSDFYSLTRLIFLFCTNKFDAVHSITPKAGLLAMLAAFIAFIPLRIHCFTGQVWVTRKGLIRKILRLIDKLIGNLTTKNIVDSKSQYNFLLNQKILKKNKTLVFGSGSICGVDLLKFKSNKKIRDSLRRDFKIPSSAFIYIYLGRLNKEKGVNDLIDAFILANLKSAYLILAGPDEEEIVFNTKNHSSNIIFTGYTKIPQDLLAMSDIICLPSYREGFGTVVIEAAAVGIPAIVSNIYGLSDTIVKNQTGLTHKPRDIKGIVHQMVYAYSNQKLMTTFGKAAQKRARIEFDSKILVNHWKDFYIQNLT
tara:strand:- start:268 stop:1392 length:1125 start_codon:yes stop_codon:yes gene_type:complete